MLCILCIFVFLQYFDTVGWVFWPVKLYPRHSNLYCVGGAVKPCSLTHSLTHWTVFEYLNSMSILIWHQVFTEVFEYFEVSIWYITACWAWVDRRIIGSSHCQATRGIVLLLTTGRPKLDGVIFSEIMGTKHIGVTTLTFQGHVTSSVTWQFDYR